MRRRVRGGGDDTEVNITPLLDIVFIMLIFFIVTATFVSEQGISPNLPEPPPPNESPPTPPPTMILTVQANGFVRVDGGRQIDPRSVKNVVSGFIAKDPSKSIVIVSAEPEATTGDTIVVLDQARDGAGDNAGRITLTQAERR